MHYDFATYTPEQGWKIVQSGKMSISAARAIFTRFTEQGFSVRAFRGLKAGRMVGAYYRPEHLHALAMETSPSNMVNIEFRLPN